MQNLNISDIEIRTGKKVRKDAVSFGWDVAEHYTGHCCLRSDKNKVYIDSLEVIETNPKEDIMHRMERFINSINKIKQNIKYKEFKIHTVEDSWFGTNPDGFKSLTRFSTIIWVMFRKECDDIYFILPTSARSQIGFNKNDQIELGNVKPEVYTRDTFDKNKKLKHKKGEAKKIDIKLLVMDYLKTAFGVDIKNPDEADGFVLALAGLLK